MRLLVVCREEGPRGVILAEELAARVFGPALMLKPLVEPAGVEERLVLVCPHDERVPAPAVARLQADAVGRRREGFEQAQDLGGQLVLQGRAATDK